MILDELFSSGGHRGRGWGREGHDFGFIIFFRGWGWVIYIHTHTLQTILVALCLSSRATKNDKLHLLVKDSNYFL